MKYTTLGRTGPVVSRFSFGAMTFGEGRLVGNLHNDIDQPIADRMTAVALDAGINLFDTADAYTDGQSEVMLGKALGRRRGGAIVATKCGFRLGEAVTDAGLSYRRVILAAEQSLRRLGTDWIDLYQVHIPDPVTPPVETARALDDLVRRGLVRYVGYSNLPAWLAAKFLTVQERHDYARFVSAQMYYSLLGRDLDHEVAPFCQDAGVGVLVWSPLASGFLTGKYTRENPAPEDARRNKFNFPPIDVEKGYDVVAALARVGQRVGASPAQVALAWLLTRPFVSSVIVGATSMKQLDENLKAAAVTLPPEAVNELDELTRPPGQYPGWMQPMGLDPKVKEALDGVSPAAPA